MMPAAILTEKIDVFRSAAASYFLSALPSPQIRERVYLNGLLMLPVIDYTLTGHELAFTAEQNVAAMDQPVIQVMYWVPLV